MHRELGIPEDQRIPAKRLASAARSDNPEIRRDAIRAETMKKWHHGPRKAEGGEVPTPLPMYQVWNRRTGDLMGTYKNRTFARNKVNALDNDYGGYAHYIKTITPGEQDNGNE